MFHGAEFHGVENLPEGAALFIGLHSTHNADIFPGQQMMYKFSGRVVRGLIHHLFYMCMPFARNLGLVPGTRGTAVELLKAGFYVGVLPGGAEEAMQGHENAYKLHPKWNERRGYAMVAMEANVPIVPTFARNVEEMKFNPIIYVLNLIGFTRVYSRASALPYGIGWFYSQVCLILYFMTTYLAVPVPVKVTNYIGKPIYPKPGQTADELAEEAKLALQALIDKHQPHGHSYLPGLMERLHSSPSKLLLKDKLQ